MRPLIYTLALAGLIWPAAQSSAAQIIVSSSGQSQAILGTGYRDAEEGWADECVSGTPTYTGRQDANISLSSTVAHSMLEKELGFEAHTKAKWGAAKASASADFLNSSKESAHSIVAVYKADYIMKNAYLTDIIDKSVDPKSKRLKEDCGDGYVKSIGRGAKLFFSIRIDFVSEEQKRKFAAAASYSNTAFSVSTAIHENRNSFDSRSKVTVQAYQLGGDVRELSHIFGAKTEADENKKSLALVSCTFGKFDSCDEALDNALKYAQNELPKQLATNEGNPDLGPANLYYVVQPYEGHSPAVVKGLKENRRILEDLLNTQTEILGRAYDATTNRVYPLADDQSREAKQILEDVRTNMSALLGLADDCYSHIGNCKQNADLALDALIKITNPQLNFPPKSFLQFCGLGYYIDPDQNRKLRDTIYTILAVAEKVSAPDAPKNGNPADNKDAATEGKSNDGLNRCENANTVLKSMSKFDVTVLRSPMGKWEVDTRISLLDPFVDLGHFTDVNLTGQRLESMENLTYFKRASKIDLSDNEIRQVSDLSAMEDLVDLSVGGNRLRSADGLGSPRNLARLDVRNNTIDLVCPPVESLKVCIQKSYAGRIASSSAGADLPRAMVRPAVTILKDGRIYMSSGTDTVIYNPKTNERILGAAMHFSRRSHTATLLDDGRVLIVGGNGGGQTSVEVYDPTANKYGVITLSAPSRIEHSAVKLRDGRVLISGGYDSSNSGFEYRPTQGLSIFNPSSNKFENVGNMLIARASHTSSLLPDGRVLIVGGYTRNGGQRMTEIFNPETYESKNFVPLNEGRYGHSATVLKDGRILIAGGLEKEGSAIGTLEYFDPKRGVFKYSYEHMKTARAFHTATDIDTGQVIFAGGSNSHYALLSDDTNVKDTCTAQIEVYTPQEESFTDMGRVQLTYARAMHSAVVTQQGMIFIVGGSDPYSNRSVELISFGGIEP